MGVEPHYMIWETLEREGKFREHNTVLPRTQQVCGQDSLLAAPRTQPKHPTSSSGCRSDCKELALEFCPNSRRKIKHFCSKGEAGALSPKKPPIPAATPRPQRGRTGPGEEGSPSLL